MAVKIAGPVRPRPGGRAAPARRAVRLPLLAAAGAAGAGLFWCYLRLSATFPGGSDGASNALQAWDLLHGNWLLRGWTLTDVSFYTTELPEYAAVELARGLTPGVLHVAAALTYTLLVALAGLLARGRARGAEAWAGTLIAAGIMTAPQLGDGVHVLLGPPDHVGTQVLILGAFLLLERAPRRWYTPCAGWALLTAATVADKITIVDAVVPLAFVGLLHAAWTRRPSRHRFELSLAVAAGAAAGAAGLLLALIGRAGGFTLLPVRTALTTPGGAARHLPLAWHGILSLFGADVAAARGGPQAVLACLHAPGIALAVAAFAVVAWRVPSPHDFMSDVLAVGIVVNLAGFVASVIPATPFDTREAAALLPFGAVLAGRVFGPRLAPARRGATASPAATTRSAPTVPPAATASPAVTTRPAVTTSPATTTRPATTVSPAAVRPASTARPSAGRSPAVWPPVARSSVAWLLTAWPLGDRSRDARSLDARSLSARSLAARLPVAALAVAGACQLAALGYGAAQPAAADPEQALAGWLAAHGLTSGLGTFTDANLTTLDSGGRVRLRAVSWVPGSPPGWRGARRPSRLTGQAARQPPPGGAVPRLYQSSASWYDPRAQSANFVVSGTADGPADLVPWGDVLALAGPPARTYRFRSFTIMVWDENLLARLGGPPSRVPGNIGHS